MPGETDTTATDAGQEVPEGTEQQESAQSATQQGSSDSTSEKDTDATDWKEQYEKQQKFARKNEERAKANKAEADKQAAMLAKVLETLGVETDGKPDPQKVAEQLTQERDKAAAQARQTTVELAVFKAAGKLSADPDALLDSRAFAKEVADLDPASDSFGDDVTAAIKGAVKANPKFAIPEPQPAARSGSEMSGAPEKTTTKRPTSLSGAVTAAYRT